MIVEAHPLYPAPGTVDVEGAMKALKCDASTARATLIRIRAEQIERERADPFNYVFAPRVWTVVWSLLDWPWWPGALEAEAKKLSGLDLWGFMKAMRRALGFDAPVTTLWVSGANGSGKSELISYMANAHMAANKEQLVYALHTTQMGSVDAGMHKKLYRYIPSVWKECGKGRVGYVSYKEQNGFSDAMYTLPNGSKMTMKFYSQPPETDGEGFDADAIFADESIPQGWFERLPARVGRKNGFVVHTNTPQSGYTEVVNEFMEGLTVTRWAPGWLLAKDGGEPLVAQALGLSRAQYATLCRCHAARPPVAPTVPEAVPEDCWRWLGEVDPREAWRTMRRALKDAPAVRMMDDQGVERVFEAVPRVGLCADRQKAVVWFHASDNPFGYPRNLAEGMRGKDAERVKCRLYGIVVPTQHAVLTGFRREVHVVRREMVPQMGTRYMVIDPAPGRNPFVLWAVCVGKAKYVYREFPGPYLLPGIGNPGPWAKTSGRKKGVNDGDRAEATQSFGWGTAKYKAVFAWLEGWRDFRGWALGKGAEPVGDFVCTWPHTRDGDPLWPREDVVRSWMDSPWTGDAEETVRARLMDPRGGGAPHVSTEGTATLLGDFDDMGLRVEPAFSGTVLSGLESIVAALDYDRTQEMGIGNEPTLFVSEDCPNLIRAMETWKDLDGEASATKDPIDCLRYLYTSECEDVGECAARTGMEKQRGRESGKWMGFDRPPVVRAHSRMDEPGRRVRARVW